MPRLALTICSAVTHGTPRLMPGGEDLGQLFKDAAYCEEEDGKYARRGQNPQRENVH